jgi:hypothetical protein
VQRTRDRLHPRATQRAAIEIRTTHGRELPASYQQHSETEAEERLRLGLLTGGLVALTDDGTVDSDYWRTDGGRMTLSFGAL